MTPHEIIEIVKERLVAAYHPKTIYLFGSWAWGAPDETSDVDIIIILNKSSEKLYKRSIPAYQALKGLKISKDILVLTSEEFNEQADHPSSLCYMVKEKGVKLYEAV